MTELLLRAVTADDLPIFFEHQRDPESHRLAAFRPRERDAFMAHWQKILANETGVVRTVVVGDEVVGNVLAWEDSGRHEVGYWIAREHWGKGLATRALAAFLEIVRARPLYAHVARHNGASLRVLEKCGFRVVDEIEDRVEWLVLVLGTDGPVAPRQQPQPTAGS